MSDRTPAVKAAPERELVVEAERLGRAEQIAGHAFADRRLLLQALTHRSYLNEHDSSVGHNEVLEFLGDAVLSLVVVEHLMGEYPDAPEGELSERRAAHVSAENLARASVSSGLAELVRTGNARRRQGASVESGLRPEGQLRKNVAADVVEAVLGAVYRDGGLAAARLSMRALVGAPVPALLASAPHPKRALSERLQRVFGQAPEYVVVACERVPGQEPRFAARVVFHGHLLGEGNGKSKATATEAAAAAAVGDLAVVDDPALRARLGKST